jgi:hypothetical protein
MIRPPVFILSAALFLICVPGASSAEESPPCIDTTTDPWTVPEGTTVIGGDDLSNATVWAAFRINMSRIHDGVEYPLAGSGDCVVIILDRKASDTAAAPEEVPVTTVGPVRADLVTPTQALLTWETNVPTVGIVVWGRIGEEPAGVVRDEVVSTSHRVAIEGLVPGETYSTHVVALDQQGRTVQSDPQALVSPSAPRNAVVDGIAVGVGVGATLGVVDMLRRRRP